MPDEEEAIGIDIQSINFRQGEEDLIVEITYAERRGQIPGIAKFEMLMFEGRKAIRLIDDVIHAVEDLVDEILIQRGNPPMRLPGRRHASS